MTSDSISSQVEAHSQEISALFNVKPPRIRVFTDLGSFLESYAVLNEDIKGLIQEDTSTTRDFATAKKDFIERSLRINSNRSGLTARVTIPDSDTDAIVYIKPNSEGRIVHNSCYAEGMHVALFGVEKALHKTIPIEVHETLEFMLAAGSSHFTPGFIKEHAADVVFRHLEGGDIGLAVPSNEHYIGAAVYMHAESKLERSDLIRGAGIILATESPTLCKDPTSNIGILSQFIDNIANNEKQNAGSINEKVADIQGRLQQRN